MREVVVGDGEVAVSEHALDQHRGGPFAQQLDRQRVPQPVGVHALGDAGSRGKSWQQAPDIAVIHRLAECVFRDAAEKWLA